MSYTDKDAWFTPRSILDELGKFDLDPANSTPENHPTADKHFGPAEDGLIQDWTGRVWLNPPFSNARPFIEKLIEHGDGIALGILPRRRPLVPEGRRGRGSSVIYRRPYFVC